jgi:hypothetical protein
VQKHFSQALEQNDWQEFKPLFGGGKIKLCDTLRAVTPFGGLSVFIEFLGRIGLVGELSAQLPYEAKSPNRYEPGQILVAFMLSVIAGGRRFAALQRLAKQKKVPKTFAVPCHVVDLSGAKYGRSTGLSGMSPCNRSRTGNECTCQSESVSLAERWFARSKDISKT